MKSAFILKQKNMGMYFEDNDSSEKKFVSIDEVLNQLCNRIDATEAKLDILNELLSCISVNLKEISCTIETTLNKKETARFCVTDNPINNVEKESECELATSDNNTPKNLEIRFLGSPSGAGFEVMNEKTEKTISTLYILEIDRENRTAYFYPNKDNLSQLIYDKTNLLDYVCDVEGTLTSSCNLNISREHYGKLQLNADYWELKKKCLIIC